MSGQKTIVHITYKISAGGLEQVLLQTVNGCEEYRHIVISLTTIDDFQARFKSDTQFFALNKQSGNSINLLKQVYKLVRKLAPDIVHTYNLAGAEFLAIAKLAGVKYCVHSEHGTPQTQVALRSKKQTFLRKVFLMFADCVVVVSAPLSDFITKVIKVPSKKVRVVANGVNTDVYKPYAGAAKNTFTIGTVARLSKEKNQGMLIEAFHRFLAHLTNEQKSQCFLRIVGDGPQRKILENSVAELNLEDNVIFVGNSNQVYEQLCRLNVFALTSISEGMPMTILEAMATGLPILSTDVGDIGNLIRKSQAGELMPVNDSAKLADLILTLYEDPEHGKDIGHKGSAFVTQHCSHWQMLEEYKTIYQGI